MENITITIEQNGKKALFHICIKEDGNADIKTQWVPAMDKNNMQEKDYFALKFLRELQEVKF